MARVPLYGNSVIRSVPLRGDSATNMRILPHSVPTIRLQCARSFCHIFVYVYILFYVYIFLFVSPLWPLSFVSHLSLSPIFFVFAQIAL